MQKTYRCLIVMEDHEQVSTTTTSRVQTQGTPTIYVYRCLLRWSNPYLHIWTHKLREDMDLFVHLSFKLFIWRWSPICPPKHLLGV